MNRKPLSPTEDHQIAMEIGLKDITEELENIRYVAIALREITEELRRLNNTLESLTPEGINPPRLQVGICGAVETISY